MTELASFTIHLFHLMRQENNRLADKRTWPAMAATERRWKLPRSEWELTKVQAGDVRADELEDEAFMVAMRPVVMMQAPNLAGPVMDS